MIDGESVKRSRFNLSLSLGRTIREGMECDHIVPIKEGGGDDWANLQELTTAAHRRKTALDNLEADKKRGITLGIPIIALHSGIGEETRFDSVIAARRKLGIHNAVIDMSLKGETIKGDYVFSHTPEHLAEQADLPGEVWVGAVSSLGLIPKTEVSDRGAPSVLPSLAPSMSAVAPSRSAASTDAPFPSSSLHTSVCPSLAPSMSGVLPNRSAASTVAPFSSSSLQSSVLPSNAHSMSAVAPSRSAASTDAPFSSSSLQTSLWPPHAATMRAVLPSAPLPPQTHPSQTAACRPRCGLCMPLQ
jgi:hypothetical protein